jgi:hypothetical protein
MDLEKEESVSASLKRKLSDDVDDQMPWYNKDTQVLLASYGRLSDLPPSEATPEQLAIVSELDHEIWKTIPGHQNYMISTFGRCYSKVERTLKSMNPRKKHGCGYVTLQLYGEDKLSTSMHAAMGRTFLPTPKPDETVVDHINGIRNDNHIRNLRWATRSLNSANRRPTSMHKGRPLFQHFPDGRKESWPTIGAAAASVPLNPDKFVREYVGTSKLLGDCYWTYEHEDEEGVEWRPTPLAGGLCAGSNGKIRFPSGRITPGGAPQGYNVVGHLKTTYLVSRLVCSAFNTIPEHLSHLSMEDLYVNHIDGIKTNNTPSNLEWVTPGENTRHAFATGLANSSHINKPVVKMDLDGKDLCVYESMADAARKQNPPIKRESIFLVCNGMCNTAGGFRWRYVDPKQAISRF